MKELCHTCWVKEFCKLWLKKLRFSYLAILSLPAQSFRVQIAVFRLKAGWYIKMNISNQEKNYFLHWMKCVCKMWISIIAIITPGPSFVHYNNWTDSSLYFCSPCFLCFFLRLCQYHLAAEYCCSLLWQKCFCLFPVMNCSAPVDILFLLDGTYSIGKGSFERSKYLAMKLCDALDISPEKVSLHNRYLENHLTKCNHCSFFFFPSAYKPSLFIMMAQNYGKKGSYIFDM